VVEGHTLLALNMMTSFNQTSGYNPDFDIAPPETDRKFNFKNDLEYGQVGESFVASMLESLINGSFEIKTDRYRNGNMVIETDQNPNLSGWKKSGINVTKADWWVYVYALDGSITIIKIDRLKRYLRMNKHLFNQNTKRVLAEKSSNPAKGFILKPNHVMDMMINKKYDAIGETNE
jgi:hypothetical protein